MQQLHRYHLIEVKKTKHYFEDVPKETTYDYKISGVWFPKTQISKLGDSFKTVEEALEAAKTVIDEAFQVRERAATVRRNLVLEDYEHFVTYLKSKNVSATQINLIASTLTLVASQKEMSPEELSPDNLSKDLQAMQIFQAVHENNFGEIQE